MILKCDELLSNFAFTFNLRRYTVVVQYLIADMGYVRYYLAGAYTRPLFGST